MSRKVEKQLKPDKIHPSPSVEKGRKPQRDTYNGGGIDPFRSESGDPTPEVEEVARGVISDPHLLQEIFRLLAWTEPELLQAVQRQLADAVAHREAVLAACREGRFGRDYVAGGESGYLSIHDEAHGKYVMSLYERMGRTLGARRRALEIVEGKQSEEEDIP